MVSGQGPQVLGPKPHPHVPKESHINILHSTLISLFEALRSLASFLGGVVVVRSAHDYAMRNHSKLFCFIPFHSFPFRSVDAAGLPFALTFEQTI